MEADHLLQQISEHAHLKPGLTVVIAAEVRLLREALAETLRRDRAFTIAGLPADLSQTLNIIHDRQPDVVLIDAAFSNGLDVVRQIRNLAPKIQVIVVAIAETEESIFTWAEAGVSGYIPRTSALADLVALLAEVLRGEQSCSGRVASGLLRRISEGTHHGNARTNVRRTPALTDREQQIILLIGAGLSNKDIARRLDIGVPTTKSHVHNLLRKLDLQRRGQVAPWMREHETELHAAPVAQEQEQDLGSRSLGTPMHKPLKNRRCLSRDGTIWACANLRDGVKLIDFPLESARHTKRSRTHATHWSRHRSPSPNTDEFSGGSN